MRPGLRALLWSTVSHLVLLGGGLVASTYMHSQAPVLVDFTLSEGGGGGGGELGQKASSAGDSVEALPSPLSPTVLPADLLPVAASPVTPPVLSNSTEAAPVAAAMEATATAAASLCPEGPASGTPGPGLGLGSGSGEGRGTGKGSGLGSGQGAGTGAGAGDGLDVLRAIYLREHFAYIRDQIARHMVYPPCAIQGGWSGRTMVSFVVLEDGRVEDIRVQRGCGFSVLDRDAQDTVKRAAPFPKPPVSARLVIPVEYVLE